MARPSKLTPEVEKKIIDAIRLGNYYEAACAYAGISYTTFYRWMEKGEQAKSGKYCKFCKAVKQAEGDAEARIVSQWVSKTPEDWRAAQAFLEHRYSDRWGKRETHVLEGGEEPIKVKNNLGEILEEYRKLVERIQEETMGNISEDNTTE